MEKESCLGPIEDNNYSSPMPVIGIYITAATLVCFMFLISDLYQAYHRRKPWLPCRLYSLNSLTLTLLAIASKLPVDLTTTMRTGQDQLSKLCGTVLISISIGFFMPSLATMEGSEMFANTVSLTILVITVMVNICIQMATGVIFSFLIVEHVISLVLMLLILITMLYATFIKKLRIGILSNKLRTSLRYAYLQRGASHEMETMKRHYTRCYIRNPQWQMCLYGNNVAMGLFCSLSLVLLLEAFLRTFFLESVQFCEGESDYRWSMWFVVATQGLTSVVCALAIIFRNLFIACQTSPDLVSKERNMTNLKAFKTSTRMQLSISKYLSVMEVSKLRIKRIFLFSEGFLIQFLYVTGMVITFMNCTLTLSVRWLMKTAFPSEWVRNVCDSSVEESFMFRKGKMEVENWIEECRSKEGSDYLINLLKEIHPYTDGRSLLYERINKCLFLVYLVRIPTILLPLNSSESIVHALEEAFEIIYFIEINYSKFDNDSKGDIAKDLWMNRNVSSHWFEKDIIKPLQQKYTKEVGRSVNGESSLQPGILDDFIESLGRGPYEPFRYEALILKSKIRWRTGDSVMHIHSRIKQVFVEVMYLLLTELSDIVFEYISQSPLRECESRLRTALKFLIKFEQLESQVPWLHFQNTGSCRGSQGTVPSVTSPSAIVDINENTGSAHSDIESAHTGIASE